MNYCNQSVEIACPARHAFALFSDPMRLPEWAIEYCQRVEEVEGGFRAHTVQGERCFAVRADAQTGVADACSGDSQDKLDEIMHIRVVPIAEELTLVSFVFSANAPDEVFEQMSAALRRELDHVKELLEGSFV